MPTVVSVFAVEPSRIGGTETFARELSVQLAHHGWISVLCFETEPPPEVRRFLDLPNIRLEVLPGATSFNSHALRRLARIIRTHKPTLLHLHFSGFVGFVPWLSRLMGVKKIFFTDHSSRPENYLPKPAPFWKRALVRVINAPITKVICVSEYGCRCMKTMGLLPDDRYCLVYNGVDLSRVKLEANRGTEFRRRFSIPDSRVMVAQVSWMIPEKGVGDLLQAAQLVCAENDDVHFVIVGEGAYRKRYMEQAQEMGLKGNITWTGLVKDPFTEGVFDAADIVCQLSRWEELFGWMIAEAMAHGKPVVATRVGGIPELLVDGETGILVPRGDYEAAAQSISRLIRQVDLRSRYGFAGAQRVSRLFNLRDKVRELLGVYGAENFQSKGNGGGL